VNELERVEREAVRSVVVAAGGVTADVGGAMCSAYPPLREHPILNRAMPVNAHVDLDAIESFFEAAGTSFVVAVRPRLASLNRELDGRGYRRAGGWTKFSRDASPAPRVASDLEITAAGPTDAQAFADVLMEGFGGAPQGRDVWTQVPGLRGGTAFSHATDASRLRPGRSSSTATSAGWAPPRRARRSAAAARRARSWPHGSTARASCRSAC